MHQCNGAQLAIIVYVLGYSVNKKEYIDIFLCYMLWHTDCREFLEMSTQTMVYSVKGMEDKWREPSRQALGTFSSIRDSELKAMRHSGCSTRRDITRAHTSKSWSVLFKLRPSVIFKCFDSGVSFSLFFLFLFFFLCIFKMVFALMTMISRTREPIFFARYYLWGVMREFYVLPNLKPGTHAHEWHGKMV